MTPATDGSAATVDEVLITAELSRRPARPPDHEAESRALGALAAVMADAPEGLLQTLADLALTLCRAGSAGVSVREPGPGHLFRWRATAGAYAPLLGNTVPRDFSPCGTVLDRGRSLLMADPVRFFPYIATLPAPVRELLLVPFGRGGVTVGTVWVVAHAPGHRFDAEDERLIASLTRFAGAAVRTLDRIAAAEAAGRSLRASEELLRLATDAAELGVWVWDVDADRVSWENDRPYQLFDLDPSVGPINVARFRDEFVHPDDAGAFERAVADATRTGERFYFRGRLRRTDGEVRWVEFTGKPVRPARGSSRRMHGTAADVTERKRAEDELKRVTAESERRRRLYEAALNNTPDLVYVFDLDHRFVYANKALLGMWGKTWDEAIGWNCLELGYEGWHASMHDAEIERVRATGAPIRGEVPFLGTNGRRVYDYIFVPVFGAGGEVEAVAGTTRDVTDRQAMEQALRDADRKKDDFIALLAHELRNPLAPIRSGLQVIRLSDDRATRDRARAMMDRQLAHMVRLIDDLLDVSRINRNKLELCRARVALADAVGSAVDAARPALDDAGHELTVTLPPHPVFLDADLTRLSQVFSNLLANSARYTPPGGRVWLSAADAGGTVTVTVRDTGIGIPPESQAGVFDMFAQVDRSVERTAGGLGIGLALVRWLVEMHGGTVAVLSDGEGRGSEFTVTLPAAADTPADTDAAADGAPDLPRERRRVLVVDDNRDGADSLALMLELLGDEVCTAHDGEEAVERAEAFRPDVILMDLGMPRLNGLDATRRIRRQEWGRGVTVIALTGWGQDADRERTREAGCDGHLVKPVDVTDLERLLSELGPYTRGEHARGPGPPPLGE